MKIELLLNASNYDFNSNSNPTDVENNLKDFCGNICSCLHMTPPELRLYNDADPDGESDPFREPDLYHLSDPLDYPCPFEDDPCAHPLNQVAKYSYFNGVLYVRSDYMREDTLELLQYAVARELTKMWILTNRDKDWYNYPCSEVPESWYLLMIPDAFASVLMTKYHKSKKWDRFGIGELNDSWWNDFSEAIELCEKELKMLEDPDRFYRE